MSRAASLGLAHTSVIPALVAGITLSSARSPAQPPFATPLPPSVIPA